MKEIIRKILATVFYELGICQKWHARFGAGSWANANWLRRHKGMKIGVDSMVNVDAQLMDKHLLIIGSRSTISFCTFITHDALHNSHPHLRPRGAKVYGPTVIGNNVLIGCNALIYPETVIGDGCIICAGAIVKGVIPPGTVVRAKFDWSEK